MLSSHAIPWVFEPLQAYPRLWPYLRMCPPTYAQAVHSLLLGPVVVLMVLEVGVGVVLLFFWFLLSLLSRIECKIT